MTERERGDYALSFRQADEPPDDRAVAQAVGELRTLMEHLEGSIGNMQGRLALVLAPANTQPANERVITTKALPDASPLAQALAELSNVARHSIERLESMCARLDV
jgi:hypothetical protein